MQKRLASVDLKSPFGAAAPVAFDATGGEDRLDIPAEVNRACRRRRQRAKLLGRQRRGGQGAERKGEPER